jgi:hypothetical protein
MSNGMNDSRKKGKKRLLLLIRGVKTPDFV